MDMRVLGIHLILMKAMLPSWWGFACLLKHSGRYTGVNLFCMGCASGKRSDILCVLVVCPTSCRVVFGIVWMVMMCTDERSPLEFLVSHRASAQWRFPASCLNR